MKNKHLLIFGFIILLISSCYSYRTQFIQQENAKVYPSKYPCKPKVTIKLDEKELGKWELIGICRSDMPVRGGMNKRENVAMEEIIKCACEHGGDLVKITSSKEVIHYNEYGANGMSDIITAEIYRWKGK